MLAIIGGAGPRGYVHHGQTWTELPAFKNGFSGFANAAMLCIWAVGDLVYLGVLNAEAEYPRFSMAKVATVVPWRVAVMYCGSVILISVVVPSDNPNLLGGTGAAASPFVIAAASSGIKGIPDLINACMIIGIFAVGLESVFLPSRILRHMAIQKLVPEIFAKTDRAGRPRYALLLTLAVGVTLVYMGLSSEYIRRPTSLWCHVDKIVQLAGTPW
jgi:yeast amino acid transporter